MIRFAADIVIPERAKYTAHHDANGGCVGLFQYGNPQTKDDHNELLKYGKERKKIIRSEQSGASWLVLLLGKYNDRRLPMQTRHNNLNNIS